MRCLVILLAAPLVAACGATGPLDLAAPVDLGPPPDLAPRPFCNDKLKNGRETDIDCGGPTCARCPDQKGCSKKEDCLSWVCTGGRCIGGKRAVLSFKEGQRIPNGGRAWFLSGDVNRDGRPDVLISTGDKFAFEVLLGRGDGTLLSAGGYGKRVWAGWQAVLADLNRDNKLDLALPVADTGEVAIFLGAGDGTFKELATFPTLRKSGDYLAAGDCDGDGYVDLINSGPGDPHMGRLPGNGTGRFETMYWLGHPGEYHAVALADFNGDRFSDVVAGGPVLSLFMADRHIAGEYASSPAIVPCPQRPAYLLVADLNRDGRPDLVVDDGADHAFSTLLGDGSGLSAPSYHPSTSSLGKMTAADFDGDGALDLAFDSFGGGLSIFLNAGDGWGESAFQERLQIPGFLGAPFLGTDLTGDGLPELVVSSSSQQGSSLLILINNSR